MFKSQLKAPLCEKNPFSRIVDNNPYMARSLPRRDVLQPMSEDKNNSVIILRRQDVLQPMFEILFHSSWNMGCKTSRRRRILAMNVFLSTIPEKIIGACIKEAHLKNPPKTLLGLSP